MEIQWQGLNEEGEGSFPWEALPLPLCWQEHGNPFGTARYFLPLKVTHV
jgi:hypothetical protein